MQTVKTTLIILTGIILLGACGHKGPLYLPDESPASKPAIEQESAVGEKTTESKEDAKKEKEKELAV
jgi:predicted small lipoprotein YifL